MSSVTLKAGDCVGPWIIKEKIGEGAFGSVYSATCPQLGDEEYAIKMATVNKVDKKNQAGFMISHEVIYYRLRLGAFRKDFDEIPHFPRAKSLMKDLITGTTSNNKIIYLAMERFPVSLTGYLEQHNGRLPEYLCYVVAASCIKILQFLHTHCVIYNDIKIDNFMLRETPSGFQIVIVDFGAAEVKTKDKIVASSGPRGTPLFTSINSNSLGPMYFSDDLSGLSNMICFLLLGGLPWDSCTSEKDILSIKQSSTLETHLHDYPELLSFFLTFKTTNTDTIDYTKWIKLFSSLTKEKKEKQIDSFILPKIIVPMEKTNTFVIRVDNEVDDEEKEKTVKKLSIKDQINHSPSSIHNHLLKEKIHNSLVHHVKKHKRKKDNHVFDMKRMQPSRLCKNKN